MMLCKSLIVPYCILCLAYTTLCCIAQRLTVSRSIEMKGAPKVIMGGQPSASKKFKKYPGANHLLIASNLNVHPPAGPCEDNERQVRWPMSILSLFNVVQHPVVLDVMRTAHKNMRMSLLDYMLTFTKGKTHARKVAQELSFSQGLIYIPGQKTVSVRAV